MIVLQTGLEMIRLKNQSDTYIYYIFKVCFSSTLSDILGNTFYSFLAEEENTAKETTRTYQEILTGIFKTASHTVT